MKRTATVATIVLLILVLAIAARMYLTKGPPTHLVAKLQSSSLSEWVSQYPEARIFKIRKDGADFYEIGLRAAFVTTRFPPSRSAAIFDGRGVFVEWTGDSGDDVVSQQKWQGGAITRDSIGHDQIPR